MWILRGKGGGGTPMKFVWVCTALGLKSWPYLRTRQMKTGTLILGQNLKNETQFNRKTKPTNLMATLLKSL